MLFKEHMGLTTWKNAPDGRGLKSDVVIAKNYLDEKQIRQLERAVKGYFDYIEDFIERENVFTMAEFESLPMHFLNSDNIKFLRIMAEYHINRQGKGHMKNTKFLIKRNLLN